MTETITIREVYSELKNLKKEVVFIKEHMVDVDTILTAEERMMVDASIKNEKDGKLVSLEDVENVRNKTR